MSGGSRSAVVVVALVLAFAGPASAAPLASPSNGADAPSVAPDGLPVAASSVDAADAPPASTGTTATDNIHLTTRLALTPETPGEIGVTLRFDIPDRVTEVETTLAPGARGVETTGFAATDGDTYEWDGETAKPTISYRLPANETDASARFDTHGHAVTGDDRPATATAPAGAGSATAVAPTAGATTATAAAAATAATDATATTDTPDATAATADERYLFADAGPWALVRIPGPGVSWRYRGETVGFSRETTTAGPGAVGDRVAFLGEYSVRERTAHGQTFRLVIPEGSTDAMTVSPDAVLDSLSSASDTLRVGDRDQSVFVVAAPTGVEWAVQGLQTGDADMWVAADRPLDEADNPWLHEYVHTRQSYDTTAETRWTIEGGADYYAAALALEQGHIGFGEYADHLERGTRDPHAGAVLSDPETWASSATPYRKGSLVMGDLDRRIRLSSGGGSTFATVFARLNAEGEPVTGDRLRELVVAAANESVGDASDRYARTDAAPAVWDADSHEAAFGTLAPWMDVAPPAAVEIGGPYRDGDLRTSPATVAVGETVTVPTTVTNRGGAAGDYRVALTVDNRTVDAANGTLEPGTNTTVRPSWTAAEPGTYELSLDGRTYEVRVREPSTPRVGSLSADRTAVEAGESVLLTAEVVAEGAVPADGEVTVRVDGEPVGTERVRVAPDATATLTIPVAFDEPGRRTVTVGNRTLTVTVSEPSTATATDTSSTRTPGFGAVTAATALLVALAALLGVGRRRSGE
ncbi:hypothetical protein GRX01_01890 [Halobaculum sp. WSA2]|uniref:CARDB domain-containing protein n=1 Tax=Halobaculum saliterrae TaxID=2073113 RepID=A0A6B0SVY5_9EURY|nr:CARDB domain-containing protein [Halobaculum saliterrae]MXR40110.1 hypothetical protein [Halobaculum saliterrae]